MAGKSIKYWHEKYELHLSKWKDISLTELPKDFDKCSSIFSMLIEYSSASHSGLWGVTGGNGWSRFWSGRWGTNHGNEVKESLVEFKRLPNDDQTIPSLLSILNKQLGHKKLSPDGDLSRILHVINDVTGMTLENCNETSNLIQKISS